MISDPLIASAVTLLVAGGGLFLRDRDLTAKERTKTAVLKTHLDAIPEKMRAALLEWEGPFVRRLNGTYVKPDLLEEKLGRVSDHVSSLQRELTEFKDEVRG